MVMRLVPVLAAACFAASATVAQTLKSDSILSSIAVRPLSEPNPVLGADGRVHLAYELLVVNPSKLFVTLDRIEAIGDRGQHLWSIKGDSLAALTSVYGGSGRMLSPGGTAVVLMDVTFAVGNKLPPRIAARVTATRQDAGPDGKPKPMAPGGPLPATFAFTGAATAIGKDAVVIEPPLRGPGWVAFNGCCDDLNPHRAAVITVNGVLRVPERFAIDWVKLDASGRLFTGDGTKLASYAYYGAPIHAVAGGVVVNIYDEADEQVPNEPVKDITPENIGGNMLVVDIGGGVFAFYAHLQRGSLKVGLGDRVTTGQPVGLLGNTGNSTAPHLHFHVMDGPSPLDANGLPFVFTRFSSQGVLGPGVDEIFEQGQPAMIDPRLAGMHGNQLPLNNQVVDFD